MMKQTQLSQFFSPLNPPSPPSTQVTAKQKGSAKESLEPLFIREIPSDPKYRLQLQEEYSLIDKNSFVSVFLQVCTILELIRLCGEESGAPIPHIIRGSAGSSLVCYLLGITHIDPLLHGIQLARFMNTLRTDIPDIDIDVPYNRREEIYARIAKTWPGMVARISNYCTWSTKTALRESIKEILRSNHESIPRSLQRKSYDPLSILHGDINTLKLAKENAAKKIGTLKNYSLHCGGIVIFEEKVPESLIYKQIQSNGISYPQLTLNKDDTESSGFIKIDLLSNRGLAQLADICPTRPLCSYPSRDTRTERIFEQGWTIGLTFGESRGMRKLFMEMKPQTVKEIAVALALIRPAAAAEGRKQEFLQKWKRGSWENPLCRPIIYDDDAIQKIRVALSCSPAEADRWRKAFAKGNAKARIDFRIEMSKRGHSQEIIDSIVDDLNQLIYYSFCKSHAISYAQLVWALAYWKAHRPHEFWVATLNHCESEYRTWVHYREAKCSGLQLSRSKPPYTLGTLHGKPAILSSSSEQQLLSPLSPVDEFKLYGYWLSTEFFPSCGLSIDSQQRLDGKRTCRFRGLIASGRVISRDWGSATLICIGVDNREYIDLVIDSEKPHLLRWAILEGSGILTKPGTIEVKKIHGLSLNNIHHTAQAP